MITTRLGDLYYKIDYLGKTFKRHVNQIRAFHYEEILARPAESIQPPVSCTKRPSTGSASIAYRSTCA